MRVCLVYDCLYPWTVGGAERWYRALAQELLGAGHEVTYFTRRQWPRDEAPQIPGVRVVAPGPHLPLYTEDGRRRADVPVLFGSLLAAHLAGPGAGAYDVVHTASFPYFSLLAAGATRRRHGARIVVDWHEHWSAEYWREYLGPRGGAVGFAIQRACTRVPQTAFCFSRLTQGRLREDGVEAVLLPGEYDGPLEAPEPNAGSDTIVFAGRHIPEKRVRTIPPALAHARREVPSLRAVIFGDGPDRQALLADIAGRDDVTAPGFRPIEEVEAEIRDALCLVLPSVREGYGQVVMQAAALGTPSIVVAAPDNAAVELVEEGVNGTVAASGSPEALGEAILRVRQAGAGLRGRTSQWFSERAGQMSVGRSAKEVLDSYA